MSAAVKHKPANLHADVALCGARRSGGAVFVWCLRAVTCLGCVEVARRNRAAAKARFASLGVP